MFRLTIKTAAMVATAITMGMASGIMPAQALQVTVNADGIERIFELSVVSGSFDQIEETDPGRLTETPWYGNEALAELVAKEAISSGGLAAEGGFVLATHNGPNIRVIAWKPEGGENGHVVGAAQVKPNAETNYVYVREESEEAFLIPPIGGGGGGGGGAEPAAVPTPALLPGLLGLGAAALRKRRSNSAESTEENTSEG